MNRYVIFVLALCAGCFDSIVNDPCAAGFQYVGGHCVTRGELGPDASTGGMDPDGGGSKDPDAGNTTGGSDAGDTDAGTTVTCGGADLTSDPDNCGVCGHVCPSGICVASTCVGETSGHIVAIGHDFASHNAVMARVLANAAALGKHHDVGVARFRGTAPTGIPAAIGDALAQGMTAAGRPWHDVTMPAQGASLVAAGIDVVIVEPQVGNGATAQSTGAAWAAAFDELLQHSGVVVILEGNGGVSYDFAIGANVYSWTPPVDATGVPTFVLTASDALVTQVLSPYLADTTSVVYPGVTGVIGTGAGATVVHQTRY